jgi:uncharacterized protein YecE (DUF72 family)
VDCAGELDQFLEQASTLGEKLAVILVQLPPKLEFDAALAATFLRELGRRTAAAIVCEPRHISWFSAEADELLEQLRVARVATDPSLCDSAARPGGWAGIRYWRLHGSPVIYRSSYADRIGDYAALRKEEEARARPVWCIFDNTASSAGGVDALQLVQALGER